MNTTQFREIINRARVQLVAGGKHGPAGLFVTGVSQQELADIVSMAAQVCDAAIAGMRFNPKWLELGPETNMHFVFHREALEDNE